MNPLLESSFLSAEPHPKQWRGVVASSYSQLSVHPPSLWLPISCLGSSDAPSPSRRSPQAEADLPAQWILTGNTEDAFHKKRLSRTKEAK